MKSVKLFFIFFFSLFFCIASFAATWTLSPSNPFGVQWKWTNLTLSNNTPFGAYPTYNYPNQRLYGSGDISNSDPNNLDIHIEYFMTKPNQSTKDTMCEYTGKLDVKAQTAAGTYQCHGPYDQSSGNWTATISQ